MTEIANQSGGHFAVPAVNYFSPYGGGVVVATAGDTIREEYRPALLGGFDDTWGRGDRQRKEEKEAATAAGGDAYHHHHHHQQRQGQQPQQPPDDNGAGGVVSLLRGAPTAADDETNVAAAGLPPRCVTDD